MGAAAAAAVVLLGVVAAAMAVAATTVATTTTRSPTGMPLYMTKAPKLDRAHKNKFLVEAPCTQYCKNVVWQYKEVGDSTWKWADAEAHSSFPDTFYLRRLHPDTLYVLRALLKPNFGPAYAGDEIPTLEARTCPEQPPPVENLRAHSAGPGWLEVRWTPPAKEACKSHLYYQARYSLQGQVTLGAWRQFGFFRSDRWVHFRPTHPCAGWPDEFCALFTDFVKAGEQHVVEVRVSRFDELTPALSASRRLVVRADTACIVTNSCGVIGAAPPSNASAHRGATDDVDLDDSDLTTTPATLPAVATTKAPGAQGDAEGDAEGDADGSAAARRAGGDASPAGDSAFGRLAPLFLALALLALAAVPAAFFWGKRRGTSEAVALHMVPGWRRRLGDGGSQPVLAEDGVDESDDRAIHPMPSASLEVDQHGRFSWAKLPQDN